MLKHAFWVFCLMLVSVVAGTPAHAAQESRLNWLSSWGSIDLNSIDDPVIPSSHHGQKGDIENTVRLCNANVSGGVYTPRDYDYSKIRVYQIDFNGDGRTDGVTDGSDYFRGITQTASCPYRVCNDDGCFVVFYINRYDSQQTVSGSEAEILCEQPPRLNNCGPLRNEACPYTPVTQCSQPVYNRQVAWEGRAYSWTFLNVSEFRSARAAAYHTGVGYKHRDVYNNNPVLRIHRAAAYCTLEEMDANNNGIVSSGEQCIKYLQYTGDNFVDLYNPVAATEVALGDVRYAWRSQYFMDPNDLPRSQVGGVSGRGQAIGDGRGFRLASGNAFASQMPNFQGHFMCQEYINNSSRDIFVPNNTDVEFESFNRAVAQGKISGVSTRPCQLRFTHWEGRTSCAGVNPACDQVTTISARRKCQRSSTAWATEADCAGISDPQPISGFRNKLHFTAQCYGDPCPSGDGGGDGGGGGGDGGGGGCCFSGIQAKVRMADGTQKDVAQIKSGDMVMGFDSAKPLEALKPAKVKAVVVIDNQPTVSLNQKTVTQKNRVVLENGRIIPAKDVKIGDRIVQHDGKIDVVTEITIDSAPRSIYKVLLDGEGGYVANDLRVEDASAIELQSK